MVEICRLETAFVICQRNLIKMRSIELFSIENLTYLEGLNFLLQYKKISSWSLSNAFVSNEFFKDGSKAVWLETARCWMAIVCLWTVARKLNMKEIFAWQKGIYYNSPKRKNLFVSMAKYLTQPNRVLFQSHVWNNQLGVEM